MIGFLEYPAITAQAQALFDEDVAEDGYVMNVEFVGLQPSAGDRGFRPDAPGHH